MSRRTDRSAPSLQQIENSDWGDPPADTTRLIRTVHRLRRKPLGLLTAEDVRLLLGQHVGVPFLVPRALAMLEEDPLCEGDFYPGDLLASTLRVPLSHWRTNPDHLDRLERVLASIDPDAEDFDTLLRGPIAAFRAQFDG
ncbi:contact-dependent growth inhibition system immunity protein [Amycolatopsis orientalis]|uniref:contact-dependent growth inhibition system immunity protein n=1 Tax=Amycolatopsis orientalis TaxID=31958 RepID=UPI00039AD452|nr:contact-dependent growth inhibition system immunity protein [Amycolatopsis orientalis]